MSRLSDQREQVDEVFQRQLAGASCLDTPVLMGHFSYSSAGETAQQETAQLPPGKTVQEAPRNIQWQHPDSSDREGLAAVSMR